ncbi:MAG: DHH family phosphoesterase, partial [Methanomassiliicoccales archaeon]
MALIQKSSGLASRLGEAAGLVLKERRIRVISHYDADGISAAAVLTGALIKLKKQFQVTLIRSLDSAAAERFKKEDFGLFIFSDMGSGQLELISSLGRRAIVLDHHKLPSPLNEGNVIHINPVIWGADGTSEVCGSTAAYMLADEISELNADLIDCALAGAYGDMQHIGGFKGINQGITTAGISKGFLKESRGFQLEGSNLVEALTSSVQPYLR